MRTKNSRAQPLKKSAAYPLLYPLRCPVMDYAWGQSGGSSFILKLLGEAPANSLLEDPAVLAKKPAAELWMGAHPKAPAQISQIDAPEEGRQALDRALNISAEHYLGPQLTKKGHRRLSFLFKILDAKSPLSIQAHPNSQLAKKLHSEKPEHYPDPYHKPELALCIKDMRALVGFRPLEEILDHLSKIPVLAELCKVSEYENKAKEDIYRFSKTEAKLWLKKNYAALMQSTPAALKKAAQLHLLEIERRKELNKADQIDKMNGIDKAASLFVLLTKHYGLQDPGIFCVYFLNYVELRPGEALFLEANLPHSYIRGVILECMAASDNVVRAGLSSKYCDIPTLIEMLHYRTGRPQILRPLKEAEVLKAPKDLQEAKKRGASSSCSYAVPVKDFSLCFYAHPDPAEDQKASENLGEAGVIKNNKKYGEFVLRDLNRPSILLALENNIANDNANKQVEAKLIFYSEKENKSIKTQSLRRGDIFFLPGDLESRGIRLLLQLKKGKVYRASGPY